MPPRIHSQGIGPPRWSSADSRKDIARLLAPGLLGHYKTFEVINIVAFPPQQRTPLNILCLVVAEERDDAPVGWHFLNTNRIELKGLEGWSFGVMRYTKQILDLESDLLAFEQNGKWSASGDNLPLETLTAQPSQFVPPTTMDAVPLNHVLKNNFWNGSHVFEWTLKNKGALQPLFDDPPLIQALSTAVRAHVAIDLASLSDRLGNLLIQLPVTVLISSFAQAPSSGDFQVYVAWQPQTTPRPLRAAVELKNDGAILGYASATVQSSPTTLPANWARGLHRGALWDEENNVLLAATADSSFISTIVIKGQLLDPEPRVFLLRQRDGTLAPQRVGVLRIGFENRIGEPEDDENGGWTKQRLYNNELDKLKRQGRFFQYNPAAGEQATTHEEALQDIRGLLARHGEDGAYLWDPYLDAHDILGTLFFCQHASAELRALTNGDEPENAKGSHPKPTTDEEYVDASARYIAAQRAAFADSQSNFHGLRLEYRIRRGKQAGPGFHDRFLIFPKAGRGAVAYSIGHSINAVGTVHHIMQQVDNGQLILDAFEAMWRRLDQPEHLVWKHP